MSAQSKLRENLNKMLLIACYLCFPALLTAFQASNEDDDGNDDGGNNRR